MSQISYTSLVSLILVPFEFILLILLSLGLARRQVYFVIDKVINFSLNINGIQIKLFPFFGVVSAFVFSSIYMSIANLQQEKEEHGDNHSLNQSEYEKNLFHKYRNMLIHLTQIILVFQVFISARKYENYMIIQSKVEENKDE